MIYTTQQAIRITSLLCLAAVLTADSIRLGGVCLQSFQHSLAVSSYVLLSAYLAAGRYRLAGIVFLALTAVSAIFFLPRQPAWAIWAETLVAILVFIAMYYLALTLPRKASSPTRKEVSQAGLGASVKDAFEERKVYLDSNLSLEKLMTILGTNRTYLSRAINDHYNLNYKTALATYRVNHAKKLLEENPTMKIMDLYGMCGFKTQANMDHWFKKLCGVSPQEYALEVQSRSISRKDPSNRKGPEQ